MSKSRSTLITLFGLFTFFATPIFAQQLSKIFRPPIYSIPEIREVIIQPDGKAIYRGILTKAEGIAVPGIVRYNEDGTLDPTFDIGKGPNGPIYYTRVDPLGYIYISGDFTDFNTISTKNMIRLDQNGSTAEDFDLTDFVTDNRSFFDFNFDTQGRIYIQGTSEELIRLLADGTIDPDFDAFPSSIDFITTWLMLPNDHLLISGKGPNGNSIWRLNDDGSIDDTFQFEGIFNGVVYISSQSDGKIILGGTFEELSGITLSNIARLNSDGSIDETFNSGSDTPISYLKIDSQDNIYISGIGQGYDGQATGRVAKLDPNGNYLNAPVGFHGSNATYAVEIQGDDKLIYSANFNNVNGFDAPGIIRLNSDGTVDSDYQPEIFNTGKIKTVTIDSQSRIIAAGEFRYAGDQITNIARVTPLGRHDQDFDADGGSTYGIFDIEASDNDVIVGGSFNNMGFVQVSDFTKLDNTGTPNSDFPEGNGPDDGVTFVRKAKDGQFFVSGSFNQYNNTDVDRLIKVDKNGILDESFTTSLGENSSITDLIEQEDGKIVLAGNIPTYNGQDIGGMLRLNSDGTIDETFDIGLGFDQGIPYTVLQQEDGKYLVGGSFNLFSGATRRGLLRLNTDGSLDNAFVVGDGISANNRVDDIEIIGNDILVGGNFYRYRGQDAFGLVALNDEGDINLNYPIQLDYLSVINEITVLEDETILLSGTILDLDKNIASVLALIGNPAEAPPSELQLVSKAFNEIVISWTDQSTDETGFQIERSENMDGPYESITDTDPNVSIYTDNQIEASTAYFYKVKAIKGAFLTGSTNILEVQSDAIPVPSAPTNLTLTNSQETITLSWEDPDEFESGFEVERKDNDADFLKIEDLEANETTYTDVNAGIGDFTYRVRSYNTSGNSDYSNEVNTVITALEEVVNNDLILYPNPSSGRIAYSINNDYLGTLDIKIVTMTGEEIIRNELNKTSMKAKGNMEIGEIDAGTYLMIIEDKLGNTSVSRIVIIR